MVTGRITGPLIGAAIGAALAVAGTAIACGDTSDVSPTPGAAAPIPSEAGPTPTPMTSPSTMLIITERDSGSTISVTTQTQASLRLSNQYVWDPPQVTGAAIELDPVQYFANPGFSEWSIRITGTGEATIASSGMPNPPPAPTCPPGTQSLSPCPPAPHPFEVTITVLP